MALHHAPYQKTIHHDGSPRYVRAENPAFIQVGNEVLLRLRAHPDAPIERIFVRTEPDGEQEFLEVTRRPVADAVCQWWEVRVQVTMPVFPYRFLLFTADGAWWLNQRGLHRHNPTDNDDFKLLAGYQAPDWVKKSVFYQIFPDRFADGNPQNNVRDGEFVYRGAAARAARWGQPLPSRSPEDLVVFAGGDLEGLQYKLDYLERLGINAIYLNPIFTSFSNHRYDVVDYFAVDPHLGGNEALRRLRAATRGRDMHLILDIVPNHCGSAHPWFQQAQSDANSPSVEYFTFLRHPNDFACWLGVASLPKLNYRSPRLREVIYEAPDSVFRYWLQEPFAVDGWRIDGANMLGRQGSMQLAREIGAGIRRAVKETNPQAYLLGENFFDGTRQLQGDYLDATMNYSGFTKPVWFWLSGFFIHPRGSEQPVRSNVPVETSSLAATLDDFRASVPWQIAGQQFNLLGSHDTARILTILSGDPAHARLAAALLFTYPGVPSVYYGDEVGMQGDNHNNRYTMPWEESSWDQDLWQYYQHMISLRRTSPALSDGGFQWLAVEADTISFLRDHDEDQVIVIGQRGPGSRPAGPLAVEQGGIPDGSRWQELFSRRQVSVESGALPLPSVPPGAMIWRRARE